MSSSRDPFKVILFALRDYLKGGLQITFCRMNNNVSCDFTNSFAEKGVKMFTVINDRVPKQSMRFVGGRYRIGRQADKQVNGP